MYFTKRILGSLLLFCTQHTLLSILVKIFYHSYTRLWTDIDVCDEVQGHNFNVLESKFPLHEDLKKPLSLKFKNFTRLCVNTDFFFFFFSADFLWLILLQNQKNFECPMMLLFSLHHDLDYKIFFIFCFLPW